MQNNPELGYAQITLVILVGVYFGVAKYITPEIERSLIDFTSIVRRYKDALCNFVWEMKQDI